MGRAWGVFARVRAGCRLRRLGLKFLSPRRTDFATPIGAREIDVNKRVQPRASTADICLRPGASGAQAQAVSSSVPSTANPQAQVEPPEVMPSLRGVSHLIAFFAALVAGPPLVASSATALAKTTSTIYVVTLVLLFGCSALLHRVAWSDASVPWLRRLDHSIIFVFIAGTYTPVTTLALGTETAGLLLTVVWIGAIVGVLVTQFWIDAPRWVTAAGYIAVGWIALAASPALWKSLGAYQFALLAAGGRLFTLGAVVYALKKPNPLPRTFGYHEVFHAMVIAAALCHYLLVTQLVRG